MKYAASRRDVRRARAFRQSRPPMLHFPWQQAARAKFLVPSPEFQPLLADLRGANEFPLLGRLNGGEYSLATPLSRGRSWSRVPATDGQNVRPRRERPEFRRAR